MLVQMMCQRHDNRWLLSRYRDTCGTCGRKWIDLDRHVRRDFPIFALPWDNWRDPCEAVLFFLKYHDETKCKSKNLFYYKQYITVYSYSTRANKGRQTCQQNNLAVTADIELLLNLWKIYASSHNTLPRVGFVTRAIQYRHNLTRWHCEPICRFFDESDQFSETENFLEFLAMNIARMLKICKFEDKTLHFL